MPTVTVAGADAQTVTLSFDTNANAALAGQLARRYGGRGRRDHPASGGHRRPAATVTTWRDRRVLRPDRDGLNRSATRLQGIRQPPPQHAIVFGSGNNGKLVLSSTGNLVVFSTGGLRHCGRRRRRQYNPGPVDGSRWPMETVIHTGNGNEYVAVGGGTTRSMRAGVVTRSRFAPVMTCCNPPATTP